MYDSSPLFQVERLELPALLKLGDVFNTWPIEELVDIIQQSLCLLQSLIFKYDGDYETCRMPSASTSLDGVEANWEWMSHLSQKMSYG
jgi:hypothetical protein